MDQKVLADDDWQVATLLRGDSGWFVCEPVVLRPTVLPRFESLFEPTRVEVRRSALAAGKAWAKWADGRQATYCLTKGDGEPNPDLRDIENVPLGEDINAYFVHEVAPHVPDAWIDRTKVDARDG